MIESQFLKRDKFDKFPILRACKANNIDFIRFAEFLKEYRYFIECGIASKAMEFQMSKHWRNVDTTARALHEGQSCFEDFCASFFEELNTYGGNLDEESANL